MSMIADYWSLDKILTCQCVSQTEHATVMSVCKNKTEGCDSHHVYMFMNYTTQVVIAGTKTNECNKIKQAHHWVIMSHQYEVVHMTVDDSR